MSFFNGQRGDISLIESQPRLWRDQDPAYWSLVFPIRQVLTVWVA